MTYRAPDALEAPWPHERRMPTELSWTVSTRANCLHFVQAIVGGRPRTDAGRLDRLAAPVRALERKLAEWQIPAAAFCDFLVPASIAAERELEAYFTSINPLPQFFDEELLPQFRRRRWWQAAVDRQLARTLLKRLAGFHGKGAEPALAGFIREFRRTVTATWPDLKEELRLRIQPLAEQWEARGPGLLKTIGRLTDPALVGERAEIVPLVPILGGEGRAYPEYKIVAIEAVLANSMAELPETVRLAWLVAQLNLDSPRFSGRASDIRRIGPLALLPPILTAAEDVELARLDLPTLTMAVAAWCGVDRLKLEIAQRLLDWWQAAVEPWPEELAALGRTLDLPLGQADSSPG